MSKETRLRLKTLKYKLLPKNTELKTKDKLLPKDTMARNKLKDKLLSKDIEIKTSVIKKDFSTNK